jgi:hypothetical protein
MMKCRLGFGVPDSGVKAYPALGVKLDLLPKNRITRKEETAYKPTGQESHSNEDKTCCGGHRLELLSTVSTV